MERTLPALRTWPRWWPLAVIGLGVNGLLIGVHIAGLFLSDANADFTLVYSQLGPRISDGTLYDWPDTVYAFRYSPVAAYAFTAIAWVGPIGWSALHVIALAGLPRRLALVALLTFPWWADLYNGNITTFSLVAGVAALNGSRIGTVAFMALALLAPKPIMLPLLAWLVWQRPQERWTFAVVFAVHAALVLLTGYADEWLSVFWRGTDDLGTRSDWGPSRLFGVVWVPIGLGIAAWLTYRGRLGLASLFASPYWLLHYPLMVLLEGSPLLLGRGRSALARPVASPSTSSWRR